MDDEKRNVRKSFAAEKIKELNEIGKIYAQKNELYNIHIEYQKRFNEYVREDLKRIKMQKWSGYSCDHQQVLAMLLNTHLLFLKDFDSAHIYRGRLYYMTSKGLLYIDLNSYEKFFRRWGVPAPSQEMMELLYKLIRKNEIIKRKKYYDRFKLRNKLITYIFEIPNLFCNFEGNIFLRIDMESGEKNPLIYRENYTKIIRYINKKLYGRSDIELLRMSSFRSYICIMRKSDFPETLFKNRRQRVSMPRLHMEAIVHKYEEKNTSIFEKYFSPEIEKEKEKTISVEVWKGDKLVGPVHNRKIAFKTLKINLADEKEEIPYWFVKTLYFLTNGDLGKIELIAMIIAIINLGKNIRPKLNVVVSDRKELFEDFLFYIYHRDDGNCCEPVYINKIGKHKEIIRGIELKIKGNILSFVKKISKFTEENIHNLKLILKSKPIEIRDKAVGKIRYISDRRYFYITDSQMELERYQKYIGECLNVMLFKGGEFSYDKDLIREKIREENWMGDYERYWIHGIFAAYGLKLLVQGSQDKQLNRKKKIEPDLNVDKQVIRFIQEYCIREEGADCYAKDMYTVFCGYVNTMGMQPIKRLHFVRIVRDILGFRYYRPHHNTKNNSYAFAGIKLSFAATQNLASNLTLETKEDVFNEVEDLILVHLKKITSEIKNDLDIS